MNTARAAKSTPGRAAAAILIMAWLTLCSSILSPPLREKWSRKWKTKWGTKCLPCRLRCHNEDCWRDGSRSAGGLSSELGPDYIRLPEGRRTKELRRLKAEPPFVTASPAAAAQGLFRVSGLGLLSVFGLRPSGLRAPRRGVGPIDPTLEQSVRPPPSAGHATASLLFLYCSSIGALLVGDFSCNAAEPGMRLPKRQRPLRGRMGLQKVPGQLSLGRPE
jgi:hypothetical protein